MPHSLCNRLLLPLACDLVLLLLPDLCQLLALQSLPLQRFQLHQLYRQHKGDE